MSRTFHDAQCNSGLLFFLFCTTPPPPFFVCLNSFAFFALNGTFCGWPGRLNSFALPSSAAAVKAPELQDDKKCSEVNLISEVGTLSALKI